MLLWGRHFIHIQKSQHSRVHALFSWCSNRLVARRRTPLRCMEKQHSIPNQINIRPMVRVAQKKAKAMQMEKMTLDSSTRFRDVHGSREALSCSLSALTVINDVTTVTISRTSIVVPMAALLRRLNGRLRSKCQASWCRAFLQKDRKKTEILFQMSNS